MEPFVKPTEPVRVALIGAGQRSRTVYASLFPAIKPWVELRAVCDPVRANADHLAAELGVPAFYSIHDLVRARPMEAALVVTPVPSHHSLSVYLSSHHIPNLVETTWCSTIAQAQDMIRVAKENGVIVRVGENFFRFPIDRIAHLIKESGFLGGLQRVISYNDHTGYHNNSRWIKFADTHPQSVTSLEHTMPTAHFHSTPERFHTDETYRARFYRFPDNRLVMDHASNIKGFLGRHARPGYNEWQGERGTLVYATIPGKGWEGAAEVRYCSDQALAAIGGQHDQAFPIVSENEGGKWKRIYVDLPAGHLEYANPFDAPGDPGHSNRAWYGIPVAEHIVDFVLAARGLRPSEFSEQDALMSLMMEVGAHESARLGGQPVALPLTEETEADRLMRENLRKQYGVDPMDVEGMLAISYPKP